MASLVKYMNDLSFTCDRCKTAFTSRRAYERHCSTPDHIAEEKNRALRQIRADKRRKLNPVSQDVTQCVARNTPEPMDAESTGLHHRLAATKQQHASLDKRTANQQQEKDPSCQQQNASMDHGPAWEPLKDAEVEQQEPPVDLSQVPARQQQQGAATEC